MSAGKQYNLVVRCRKHGYPDTCEMLHDLQEQEFLNAEYMTTISGHEPFSSCENGKRCEDAFAFDHYL